VIDGTVDGLTPGLHGLNIHELGDLSQGCLRFGLKVFIVEYLINPLSPNIIIQILLSGLHRFY